MLRGPHQSCRILVRQRPQQNRINHTENRGVRANSERKRQDGYRGETGILAQRARTVAYVLQQRFDEGHAARVAMLFLDLLDAAEFQPGAAPGFFGREAGLDQLGDVVLEVKAELLVHLGFNLFPAEKRAQAQEQIVEHELLLSGLEDLGDRGGESAPAGFFPFELFAPEPRQLIKLRAAIVLRSSPARLDPAAAFQAMESGIERALLNEKNLTGNLVDTFGNRPAVLRFQGKRPEDQQIQRALRKIDSAVRHLFPLSLLQGKIQRLL